MKLSADASHPSNSTAARASPLQHVPGHPHWYFVGYGAKRVTFYTQQLRALNLVHALVQANRRGPYIVIGGGAAGVTAAAALATLGQRVTLLEKERYLLPLQRNCLKRHLHPHVFDWPAQDASNTRADLPLLGWRAGPAHEVAASVLFGYQEIADHYAKQLQTLTSVNNIAIDAPNAGDITYTALSPSGSTCTRYTREYGTLIYALGFGREVPMVGDNGSYWGDDSLDQHGLYPAGNYLVSGNGDGGLIDLLRILLSNTRQDELATLVDGTLSAEQRENLLKFEAELTHDAALGFEPAQLGQRIHDYYSSRDLDKLGKRLKARLNPGAHITFVTASSCMFSIDARPLHRLLRGQLSMHTAPQQIHWIPNTRIAEGMLSQHGRHMHFTPRPGVNYCSVVLRHGPKGALDEFPALTAALKGTVAPSVVKPEFDHIRFGAPRSPAHGAAPRVDDYLQELHYQIGVVRGTTRTLEDFAQIAVEVAYVPRAPKPISGHPDNQTQQDGHGAPLPAPDRAAAEGKAKRALEAELEQRQRERLALFARTALAYEVPLPLQHGEVMILLGDAGSGKTTQLKLALRAAIEKYTTGEQASEDAAEKPLLPIFLDRAPSLHQLEKEPAYAIAVAALNSLDVSHNSAAASKLRISLLSAGQAVVLMDTVDMWEPEVLTRVLQHLSEQRITALVVGRSLPARVALPDNAHEHRLSGIAPKSAQL